MDIASLGAGAAIAVTILTVVFGFLIKMKWLTTSNGQSLQKSTRIQYIVPDDMKDKINNIEKAATKTESFWKDNENELKAMFKQTDELQKLHNVRDENGVPLWYRSKALDELVTTQARALNNIALTLQKLELIQLNQSKMIESQNKIFEKIFDKL